MKTVSLIVFACILLGLHADAESVRSASVRRQFQQQNPCPATGETKGKCPGYVVDHIKPLCAGGPDTLENMQWQALAESKVKDAQERRQCRALKKAAN